MSSHRPRPHSLSTGQRTTHLLLHDSRLHSSAGAHEVIGLLRKHRHVTHITAGHNDLGDEGCVTLIEFLCSEEGKDTRVQELGLNANGLQNGALGAIARYLRNNASLISLSLSNNAFQALGEVSIDFVEAINTSRLQVLTLTNNASLSDTFLSIFLPRLSSPYLRTLNLSVLGLSPDSAPTISDYIASPRSACLRNLTLNGNFLGRGSVRHIIRTIQTANYTLQSVELLGNHLYDLVDSNAPGSPEAGAEGPQDGTFTVAHMRSILEQVLSRNQMLFVRLKRNALHFLPIARILLLSPTVTLFDPDSEPSSDSNSSPEAHSLVSTVRTTAQLWRALPLEVQLEILRYFAPVLSPSQYTLVTNFSADLSTLPPLASNFVLPTPGIKRKTREEEREEWLRLVGCDHFEWCSDAQVAMALEMNGPVPFTL
ncbi:hypothetical protein BOTBODRAFT_33645 [Botryobasidium botryosum FD-172 SS1]|uniref:F-box domain-containing protein n=1 Tax=Botryobasidium botryosum (strain FD-172 SS1) TaxID=930990 RepID=A0A067MNA9_BOTB1|nr:hypothetical protein BOTBODRAFT_33645 [Botryobasidium botryosum FD-172 SS1]